MVKKNKKSKDIDFQTSFSLVFFHLYTELQKSGCQWVLTGSYRLYLENSNLVKPNDLDILTTIFGVNYLFEKFKNYADSPPAWSQSGLIKSYYLHLTIDYVSVDVFAEIENVVDGKWLNIPNLNLPVIKLCLNHNVDIPVFSLETETIVNTILSRQETTKIIREIKNDV